MGKATAHLSGGSGRVGISAGKSGFLAGHGIKGGYSLGKSSSKTYSLPAGPRLKDNGIVEFDLKGYMDEEAKKERKYKFEPKTKRPYERIGPLEIAAGLAMADSMDYSGKHKAVYHDNIAKGEGKGYGLFVTGDFYSASNHTYNLLNIADYTRRRIDSDYAVAA